MSIDPAYVAKEEKNERTKAEVDETLRWLTRRSQTSLEAEFQSHNLRGFLRAGPEAKPYSFRDCGRGLRRSGGADRAAGP